MEWAAAKDALIAGFNTPADHQRTLRSFRTEQLGTGLDPLSHAVDLRGLLDDAVRSELLLHRFLESLPKDLREIAWIINAEKTMDVFKLVDVLREFS
ncbi:unnamed protein product [Echinostoma caproni]|uniref:FH2 domain-containing protein n=1 Tax=Echinostoma caproni TaxID=27848 RepID=A0A183ADD7_9TREM|nr:unnamed protein product [Echinostoma caproni]